MKAKYSTILLFSSLCFIFTPLRAQIEGGVYFAAQENVLHELKIDENYFVHSVYERMPAKFIKTEGGFFTVENNTLKIELEFNSEFENDGIERREIPYMFKEATLIFKTDSPLVFKRQDTIEQDLDGQWLFATRGPDTGQKRRGETSTRKTLKFLLNGRFQWIAYDTNKLQFKGTGGGSYTSKNGQYAENIEYFSRDNSRVGARLEFTYEIKGGEWHHTGNNSKGEPLYEIWAKR